SVTHRRTGRFHSPPQGTDAPRGQSKRRAVTLDRVSTGEWPSDDQRRRAAVNDFTGDGPDDNTARPTRPDFATHPGRDAPKILSGPGFANPSRGAGWDQVTRPSWSARASCSWRSTEMGRLS